MKSSMTLKGTHYACSRAGELLDRYPSIISISVNHLTSQRNYETVNFWKEVTMVRSNNYVMWL